MKRNELQAFLDRGLSVRKIAKEAGITPTPVRYWIRKYGLTPVGSTGRAKFNGHRCGHCGDTDPSKFYGKKKRVCGPCHNKYTLAAGQNKRSAVVAHMGGKCVICGFNKYECSLELHHTDPSIKDPKFSGHRGWAWERILKEMEGCVLLCGNCHPAVHAGILEVNGV